jgi:hypothetical protein
VRLLCHGHRFGSRAQGLGSRIPFQRTCSLSLLEECAAFSDQSTSLKPASLNEDFDLGDTERENEV